MPSQAKRYENYTDAFEDLFPQYLAIGMTYDEYWNGNPYLVVDYRKAHKAKQEQRNWEMWLQGLYFFNALSVANANLHRGKGKPAEKYMEKPIEIYPPSAEETERRSLLKRQQLVERLNALKAGFDARKKQEEQQNGNRN